MSLRVVLAGVAGLYVAWAGALSLMAPRLVYPFAQTPFRDPAFAFRPVAARDGLSLPVAIAQGDPDKPVILFFMGNYGARGGFTGLLDPLVDAGFGVVAMPYRGGEGLAGPVTEATLKADALAVFDAVSGWPEVTGRPIHLLGYSLGSGLALHVGAERQAASLALIAPYDKLCRVAAARVMVPACLIPGVPKWDNLALARQITGPVFLAHGLDDQLIPPRHGRRLAQALVRAGVPLELKVLPFAGHNDIGVDPRLLAALTGWAERGWRAPASVGLTEVGKAFAPRPAG